MSADLRAAAAEMVSGVSVAKSLVLDMAKGVNAPVTSNQLSTDDYATVFNLAGAIEPPYDPEMLTLIFEHSNSLRPNIDAYATNIDGFGHRFDPFLDLDADDVDERIRVAMLADAQRSSRMVRVPSVDEVRAKKEEIRAAMRMEKARLEHFFEYAASDTSFATLRRRTRQDLETTGNAYWEILRSADGEIARFVYVTAYTMRLLPLDRRAIVFKEQVRTSDLSFSDVDVARRVRRYVQIVEGVLVYFKEFGDPRVMSSTTGFFYDDLDAMRASEKEATPATEILHFAIFSTRSCYGVPRWIGALLSVVGSRQSEEVNFSYFENKSVPPLAVLVQGGRMNTDSVKRVESYVQNNIKGKRNFHRILVLEAEAPGGNAADNGRMKIDIKPLTGAQHSDALFQNYDERNIDKTGMTFRLPRMLRGDIRDFNRSTADAALSFAEMLVFQPERQDFDFVINRKILSTLRIRFWKFVSLAPIMRDPQAMSEIIRNLANANVLVPEECRQLAGDVFNKDFRHIVAAWVRQPAAFTLAGIDGNAPAGAPADGGAGAEEGDDGGTGDEGDSGIAPKPEPAGVEARLGKRGRRRRAGTDDVVKAARGLLALRNALRAIEVEAFRREALADARGA